MAAKTIAVMGDTILNTNLFTQPTNLNLRSGPWPTPYREDLIGGSHYLYELIHGSTYEAKEQREKHTVNFLAPKSLLPEQAISVWHPFEKNLNDRSSKTVWRISSTYLASMTLENHLQANRDLRKTYKAYVEALIKAVDPENHPPVEYTHDILVIDDANLGFRSDKKELAEVERHLVTSPNIVLKTRSPFFAKSGIWDLIEANRHLRDRITAVVSVESLRREGIDVPRANSWDHFIDEVEQLFEETMLRRLSNAVDRVVLSVPSAAVAIYHRGELESFIYHPAELENQWLSLRPGRTEGSTSIVTAALCRCIADCEEFEQVEEYAMRALVASRHSHQNGGGPISRTEDGEQWYKAYLSEHMLEVAQKLNTPEKSGFAAVSPRRMDRPLTRLTTSADRKVTSILGCLAGHSDEDLRAMAIDIVKSGLTPTLRGIPFVRYENYISIDRNEIEKANEIAELIRNYSLNLQDRRPLSIAVFGQPGSGKSFAVREIAKSLMGDSRVLTYNISQIEQPRDLRHAFDEIRHESVRGQVPLVFWDEFDSNGFKWLQAFLSPMQDSVFANEGTQYPFGRAIFVFAGGVAISWDDFRNKQKVRTKPLNNETPAEYSQSSIDKKVPDFVSRLRGYLDIKGLNPEGSDAQYLIRRAIVLRSAIERLAPHLISKDNLREALIDEALICAFLDATEYRHGARSLEALVGMSAIQTATRFGAEQLPSSDQMLLHTKSDLRRDARRATRIPTSARQLELMTTET